MRLDCGHSSDTSSLCHTVCQQQAPHANDDDDDESEEGDEQDDVDDDEEEGDDEENSEDSRRVMMLLAPQSGALRISAYRDFHPIQSQSNPIPIQSTYSFRAFKPFYSDQKQCM